MPSLEQSQPMEEDTEDKDESREVIHDFITEEDITDVYTCHNALFTNLTSCDWLNITSGTEIKSHDFTMPALSCHSVGAMLALQCRDALGKSEYQVPVTQSRVLPHPFVNGAGPLAIVKISSIIAKIDCENKKYI